MNVLVDRKDDKVVYNITHQYDIKAYKDGVELELTSDTLEITLEESSSNIIVITEILDEQIIDKYEEFLTGMEEIQSNNTLYLNTPNVASTNMSIFNINAKHNEKTSYRKGFMEGFLVGNTIDKSF